MYKVNYSSKANHKGKPINTVDYYWKQMKYVSSHMLNLLQYVFHMKFNISITFDSDMWICHQINTCATYVRFVLVAHMCNIRNTHGQRIKTVRDLLICGTCADMFLCKRMWFQWNSWETCYRETERGEERDRHIDILFALFTETDL